MSSSFPAQPLLLAGLLLAAGPAVLGATMLAKGSSALNAPLDPPPPRLANKFCEFMFGVAIAANGSAAAAVRAGTG